MPRTYTSKKTGKTITYVYPDEKTRPGTQPNLTILLSDPTLTKYLRDLAKQLGYVQNRGKQAGEGSLSMLVSALGSAARADTEATAQRLAWLKHDA